MARGNQNNGGKSTKRPSQTLDLEASEVKDEAVADDKAALEQKDKDGGSDQTKSGATDNSDIQKDKENALKGDSAIDAAFSAEENGQASEPGSDNAAARSGGGSFVKTLVAGIVGAVIALAGQQFMPRLLTQGDLLTLDSLNEKIAVLEGRNSAGKFDALNKRFDDVSQKFDGSQIEGALKDRLTQMEATLSDVAKVAGADNERIEGLAALAAKMNGIETNVRSQLSAIKGSLSEDMRREMMEVSKTVATQETLAQIEGVKLSAATLGKRLAVIEAQSKQLVIDLEALSNSLDGVRSETVSRDVMLREVAGLKTSLSAIDAKMQSLKSLEAEAHETARRSALALAFSNLKRAMERGTGFSSELDAVKRLSKANEDLTSDFATLESLAADGLSSDQILLKTFPQIANDAIKAETTVLDATAWDKIVGKARSTFRYRRTGQVKGDSAEAVLARMEHKFKEGLLEDVVVEAKTLSPKAAVVVKPWLRKLQARLLVESAMIKLEDQLLTALQPR